jgi:hypothetical protein
MGYCTDNLINIPGLPKFKTVSSSEEIVVYLNICEIEQMKRDKKLINQKIRQVHIFDAIQNPEIDFRFDEYKRGYIKVKYGYPLWKSVLFTKDGIKKFSDIPSSRVMKKFKPKNITFRVNE